MGKTGAGKSSMIKLLGGKDRDGSEPTVDDGLESCRFLAIVGVVWLHTVVLTFNPGTTTPSIYQTSIDNKMILLLDTPGFDDSEQTNLDILREIVSNLYLFALRPTEVEVRGVIFLHDITETRLSGSQRVTWQILKAICGENSMKNVLVGTTQWSSEGDRRFQNEELREKELYDKHWNGIYKSSRVVYGDRENALQIIRDLLARPPSLLLVQTEMINPPHTVEVTTAGRVTMPAAFVETERLKKEMAEQQSKNEEAIRQSEEAHRKEKDTQKRAQEEELSKQAEAARRRTVEQLQEQRRREEARQIEEQKQRTRREEEAKEHVEEAQRRAQAEETQRNAEAEERTRQEESARRRAEEERRSYEVIRQQEEQEQRKRQAEEMNRQMEEARIRAQVEEDRRYAEHIRKQEVARIQAEEEQRRREDAWQKEEQLRRYEEEKMIQIIEESKRQAEEAEKNRAQAEAQRVREEIQRIEAERQKWEVEQRQREEEARRHEEERQRQLEAENNRLREEANREHERLQRLINEANQRVRFRLAFKRRIGRRN